MSRHSIHALGLDFTHQTPTENHTGMVHCILKVIPIRSCGRKEGRKNLRVLLYLRSRTLTSCYALIVKLPEKMNVTIVD